MPPGFSPLSQFQISTLVPVTVAGHDISFTNSALWMAIGVVLTTLFLAGGLRNASVRPGRWQVLVELFHDFIAGLLREHAGADGMRYFPFVLTLFLFILGANLFGLLPYGFTPTSHIIVTLAMAMVVWTGVTIIGFMRHGAGFLRLFVPAGAPVWLLPMIVPIEIISYLIRPISLSVRLFANMLAGHTMLKIFAGFIVSLPALGIGGAVLGIFPFTLVVALTALEIGVAILQAYVFTILSCIYLGDALDMHH